MDVPLIMGPVAQENLSLGYIQPACSATDTSKKIENLTHIKYRYDTFQ